MKHIIAVVLIFGFIKIGYAQSYQRQTYTPTEIRSQFNPTLAMKVLTEKQRRYDNSKIINCSQLMLLAVTKSYFTDDAQVINSSFILGADYYIADGNGFVILKIKRDGSYYNSYIFCGISSDVWNTFKSEGEAFSWGEAYRRNIEMYKCDCKN
jgi:hypothetical protein